MINKRSLSRAFTFISDRSALMLSESDSTVILKLREVFRNSGFVIGFQAINTVGGFLLVLLIARYLGSKALGQYAIGASLTGLVIGILNFGIQGILIREISKSPDNATDYLGNGLGIRFFLTFPLGIGISYFIAILLGFRGDLLIVILLMALFTCVSSVTGLFYGAFQALGKFEFQFTIASIYKIFSLIGTFILLRQGQNLISVISLFILLQFASSIFSAVLLNKKFFPVSVKIDPKFWLGFIRESFPLALGGTAEFINLKSDALILGAFKGDVVTGIYNGAYNIYLGAVFLPYSMAVAFLPSVSNLFSVSKDKAFRLFRNVSLLILAISLILTLGLSIFSQKIVLLIYGEKFLSSSYPLMILALGLPFISLNRLCNRFLTAAGLQTWMFYIISTGAVLNIATNILLIPKYSYIGASITTVITEGLVLALQMWKIYRYRHDKTC